MKFLTRPHFFVLFMVLSILFFSSVSQAQNSKHKNQRQFNSKPRSNRRSKQRSQDGGSNPFGRNGGNDEQNERRFNHNWSPLDREIFHLNEQIQADLGPSTTFYSWLEIPVKASYDDIAKAYKRLSRQIHPDKVAMQLRRKLKEQNANKDGEKPLVMTPAQERKFYKEATDRFARLGLVNKILTNVESRERYDFFLKHGFPKLKGSDYFYTRYRPGVGFVFVFLYLLIGVGQYVVLKLTAMQHVKHMKSVIEDVKTFAWPSGIPSSNVKTITNPAGKTFRIYPNGDVTLLDEENPKKEYLLDVDEIPMPKWSETILFTLPKRLLRTFVPVKPEDEGGKRLGTRQEEKAAKTSAISAAAKKAADDANSEASGEKKSKSNGSSATAKVNKVGGRRRK